MINKSIPMWPFKDLNKSTPVDPSTTMNSGTSSYLFT